MLGSQHSSSCLRFLSEQGASPRPVYPGRSITRPRFLTDANVPGCSALNALLFPPLPREARAPPRQDWPGNEDRMLTDASLPTCLWVSLGLYGRSVSVHLTTISGRKCPPPGLPRIFGSKMSSLSHPTSPPTPTHFRVSLLAWRPFSSAASEPVFEYA